MTLITLSALFVGASFTFLAGRKHVSRAAQYVIPSLWKLSAIASIVLFVAGISWDFRFDKAPREVASATVRETRIRSVAEEVEPAVTCESWLCDDHGPGADESASELREYVKTLDEKLAIDTNCADAYTERGWTLSQLGQCRKGIKDLNQAIKLKPTSDAYCKRAWIHMTMGQQKQASRDAARALKLDPKNTDAKDALEASKVQGI